MTDQTGVMIARPLETLRRRVRGEDAEAGLSLIEVVVSFVVFALFSTALVGALIQIQTTSRNDRNRVAAAALAQSKIELLRDQPTAQIPVTTTTTTQTVNGVTFTVVQTVEYAKDNSAPTCTSTSTSNIAYKRITEVVSWPNMGQTKPIRTDTLRTLNVNGLDSTTGSLSVYVTGQGSTATTPQAGVTVTVTESGYAATSVVTGDDGCAVFVGLPPGTATATASATGFAAPSQATTSVATASIVAGSLAKSSMTYAQAATAVLSPSLATTLPLSLTVKNSSFTTQIYDCASSSAPCATGMPRQVALYPDPSTQVWAGTCADADPATTTNNKPTYEVNPGLTAGQTSATTTIYVGAVQVTNGGTASKTFYAEHVADASCAAGEIYNLGTIAKGANATFALPFGTWVLTSTNSVHAYVSGGNDGQAQLTPSSGTVAVTAK